MTQFFHKRDDPMSGRIGLRVTILVSTLLVLPLLFSTGRGFADSRDDTLTPSPASAEQDYSYLGVDGCRLCHRSAAKGNQYGKWQEARHSKAFETLASEKAMEYAQERSISDPQTAEECLVCHVTAYKTPDELKARTYKAEDGVGCESCHGPGSAYKSIPVMQDREKSIEKGLVIPNEETCLTCHNDKSPGFQGFDFEESFSKIAHPNPQK